MGMKPRYKRDKSFGVLVSDTVVGFVAVTKQNNK